MDTKHAFTPGPWFSVDYSGFWSLQLETGYDANTDLLDEEKFDNAEANSRLAASAPELLSALEEILEVYYNDFFMEMRSIIGGTDEYIRTKFQEIPAVMKAKEAIKKALGE
jgi:hypothetical protein